MTWQDKVRYILDLPVEERPAAPFRDELLCFRPAFSAVEMARLRALFPRPVKLDAQRMFSFMVSLSCASSALEGNTYSEIDTRTLLEDGIPGQEKTAEETKMLLNHKAAFDLLAGAQQVDRDLIKAVHAALADDAGVEGSRHFLAPENRGVIRTYDEIYIGNSTYIPPTDYPSKSATISDYLDAIIQTASAIDEPIEQALYFFTRLPYLQAFRDCNKRTSRLIGNLSLLLAERQPVSFSGLERAAYNRSMLAFYELGDVQLFKEGFLESYLKSGLRFHPFDPEVAVEIRSRDVRGLVSELMAFVVEGRPSAAADLMSASSLSIGPANEPGPDF